MQLSKKILTQLNGKIKSVPTEEVFNFPEKVLQFGTGVLLRGLPDYYIDKANKQHVFNGRIVIVKSTDDGNTEAYNRQDGLYTHCIRGFRQQQLVDEYIVNASVSRVLSAKTDWQKVLDCAADPEMQVIISNTTEVGIVLIENDNIKGKPPVSFPGKLLAFLYERYKKFKGDVKKGFVIIPTELITDNGTKLQNIIMELAHLNKFDYAFIDWLENANSFCNSLVDRIVPGKLNAAQKEEVNKLTGYADDLMIMSETYSLWAIETPQPGVKEILSFAGADDSVVITNDIHKYRELKLRLLNGTHTFSCGLAYLAGFETVKEAMEDKVMGLYIKELMTNEIAPCVSDAALSPQEALEFSNQVIDRFRNPFIEHLWINITLNYTHKMRMRNVPLLIEHYNRFSTVPEYMAMGFAAFLIFMKSEPSESGKYYGEWNGALYPVQDEHAAYFNQLWSSDSLNEIVITALSNESLWGKDLNSLPEFSYAVANYLELFLQNKVIAAIKQYQLNRNKVKSHEA